MKSVVIVSLFALFCASIPRVYGQSSACKDNGGYGMQTLDGIGLHSIPPANNIYQSTFKFLYLLEFSDCISKCKSEPNCKSMSFTYPTVRYLSTTNTTPTNGVGPAAWDVLPGSEVYMRSDSDAHGKVPYRTLVNNINNVCFKTNYHLASSSRWLNNFVNNGVYNYKSSRDRHCDDCNTLPGCAGFVLNMGQCYMWNLYNPAYHSSNASTTSCYNP